MAESPREGAVEEIAALERLLEDKKRALAAEGKPAPEHEVFKEAFHEAYGEALAPKTSIVPTALPIASDELAKHVNDVKTKAREEQLESLIELALTKGVAAAAEVARNATPWLMDELHDRLQDTYYQQLIELRKLKAL